MNQLLGLTGALAVSPADYLAALAKCRSITLDAQCIGRVADLRLFGALLAVGGGFVAFSGV